MFQLKNWLTHQMFWQVVPDSDAHRAGLQEGDQVLSVNDVDFQDIEHSKVRSDMSVWKTETCWISHLLNRIGMILISLLGCWDFKDCKRDFDEGSILPLQWVLYSSFPWDCNPAHFKCCSHWIVSNNLIILLNMKCFS